MAENFQIVLCPEKKVIRVGFFFYKLKGYLVKEATEEEQKKYSCNKYMTYPVVGDDFEVKEGEEIADGIGILVIGNEGDTVLLEEIRDAAIRNVKERGCEYESLLVDLERQGITISNRVSLDDKEELPEEIVICITKANNFYSVETECNNYYIPERECFFKDGNLYVDYSDIKDTYDDYKIENQITKDLYSLSWFFNKPNLHVKIMTYGNNDRYSSELKEIPEDWPDCVKRLEDEINKKHKEKWAKHPNDYYKKKRKDVFKKAE